MTTISSTPSIALSGMNAAQRQLDSSAHNIANQETKPFNRQETVQTEQASGGVSTAFKKSNVEGPALADDMVNQLQAKNSFLANLTVFKTHNSMMGTLLDEAA